MSVWFKQSIYSHSKTLFMFLHRLYWSVLMSSLRRLQQGCMVCAAITDIWNSIRFEHCSCVGVVRALTLVLQHVDCWMGLLQTILLEEACTALAVHQETQLLCLFGAVVFWTQTSHLCVACYCCTWCQESLLEQPYFSDRSSCLLRLWQYTAGTWVMALPPWRNPTYPYFMRARALRPVQLA